VIFKVWTGFVLNAEYGHVKLLFGIILKHNLQYGCIRNRKKFGILWL